jgi:hypothetical protein
MKITSAIPSNLVERIRQTHEASAASQSVDGSRAAALDKPEGLISRIENIASEVVQGIANDAQQIRRSVIDAIVDERFGTALRETDRKRATGTLQDILRDDPEFLFQVDNMLVLAASRLRPTHE